MTPEKIKQLKLWGSVGAIVIAGAIITVQLMPGPAPGTDLTPKEDASTAAQQAASTDKAGGPARSTPKVYETDRGTTVTEDNGIVVERSGGGVVAPGGG